MEHGASYVDTIGRITPDRDRFDRYFLNLDEIWTSDGIMLPSGYVKIAIENDPFIVSFPIDSMAIFHSYVKLPEGIHDEQVRHS